MEVVCDNRERKIIPLLELAATKYKITVNLKQMTVGDYAICYNGKILIIIERKTWKDLAASMRDGRKDNIQKLFDLREETKCSVAYLIEGTPCPAFDKSYGRIPLKNLRAHLDHIAFRDNVHILYSKSDEYTAERLCELAVNCFTNENLIQRVVGGEEKTLTKKRESVNNVNVSVLLALPSIGPVLAALLDSNEVNLYKLYNGIFTEDNIAELKYPTGATVGLKNAKNITKGIKKLNGTSVDAIRIQRKVLDVVPGIGKTKIDAIMERTNVGNILEGKDFSDIPCGKGTLGIKNMSAIKNAFGIATPVVTNESEMFDIAMEMAQFIGE